jgi:hypothetical protein
MELSATGLVRRGQKVWEIFDHAWRGGLYSSPHVRSLVIVVGAGSSLIRSALCLFHLRHAHPFFSFSSTNTATHSSTSRPSVRPTAQPSPPLHKPHAATLPQPLSITLSLAECQLSSTPTVPLHWSILSQRQSNSRLTSLKAESLVEMKLPIGLGD